MALIKLPFKAGINREIPEYANEGGYDFSNLIRFRMGYAEKLGGWANTNYAAFMAGLTSTLSTYTFNGVVRSFINWVTSDNKNLIGFGTTQECYVQNGIGTVYNNISPADYTATGNYTLRGASFRTVAVGSPIIEMVNTGFIGNITTAGSYSPVSTFYSNVALTGGSGTGAKANIQINSSGAVSAVTIIDSGTGYKYGDTLGVAAGGLGTGSGFVYTISGGTAGEVVYSSIISPPRNSGLDVGSVVYFYANNLQGALLMETSGYLVQESWPGGTPAGYKFLIGTQPSLTVNNVTIPAQYPRSDANSTPCVVTSVSRGTLGSCSISATSSVVTLTGTSTNGVIPIVGVYVSVSGMSIAGYNGTYRVTSCTYDPNTTVVVITYANTTGVGSAANGTVTWINSFQFIGSGVANAVGYEQGSTVAAKSLLGFSVDAYYLPNAGDSTTIYTDTGSYPLTKRAWSQASFYDDMIMSIQGNPIYYWERDTTNWAPAVKLSDYANTQQYQQATVTQNTFSATSPYPVTGASTTFQVEFNDYIYPGETITLASGSGSIPTTTKIVNIVGLTVTVDNPVTLYGGGGVLTGALTGGSGYALALTFTQVALSGGTGSGVLATLVVTAGAVSSVTITSAGLNYSVGDILTVPQTAGTAWLGGGTFSTGAGGNDGNGYTAGTYTGQAMTGGSGTGMIATIVVGGTTKVTSVTITNPGTGYKVGDVLSAPLAGSPTILFAYVLTAVGSGFKYTVATVTSGSVLNLSYSGQYVPTQTNRIFLSSVYQFTIALGANPYDPTNPNSTYNPLLVRWSDQANPYDWIPRSDNQSGEQTLGNGSTIVTAVTNLQIILVFTDTAVYQMQYIGAPYVFSFTLIQENISIISQNAAVTANNMTWWMGTDKFYIYNGSVQVLPCPLRRYVFTNINKDYAWKTVVGYNEGFSEVWWFYPSSTSMVNDSYVKYNFADQVWDYGSLNRTAWNGNAIQDYPVAAYSVQSTYLTSLITFSTATTIPVADTSSFHDSGILLIGTVQVVYTGKTATSFTGCTTTSVGAANKYTTVKLLIPNQLMYHDYGLDDNTIPNVTLPVQSFIQSSDIGFQEGNSLCTVNRIIPDLTYTNTNTTTCPNPVITMTIYPRLNPGSDYRMSVDTPTVTGTYVPMNEAAAFPPEQYTGQPSQAVALLTAGQGQIYTRVRGRTIALRVDTGDINTLISIAGYPIQVYANSIGNMWQLGLMRFDIRMDGKR